MSNFSDTKKTSCYQCQERHQGCHSTCERYKAFREQIEIARENKRKIIELDGLDHDRGTIPSGYKGHRRPKW